MSGEIEVGQHNVEIRENAVSWGRKPRLREVYADFQRLIAARLKPGGRGLVVECGSGIGNLKQVIPGCVTTDLFPNPWIDRIENVFALSFADGSVSSLILFDVFHHLRHPAAALRELHRVLEPGGRLILFEPGMGFFGRFVLGLFHHEPLGLGDPIDWEPPAGWDPAADGYYAAQGNAWRIFVRGEGRERLGDWNILEVSPRPAVPWLLTGGFRGPQLVPDRLWGATRWAEWLFARCPRLFASRLLVVLEAKERRGG